MGDLHLSPYTGRIIEVSGADHREALIVETALRWGLGEGREHANPGTLDHLDAREFDSQVREVVRLFAAHPSERGQIEREAVAEHLVPSAPLSEGTPRAGDRVRVWFTGNGVVVAAPDDPWMRPYAIRLDGEAADSYHRADQVRPEVVEERRPVRPGPGVGEGPGLLVEWDGGWEIAATPEAAEKIVQRKIAEWGDADRDEFRIVPNEPPTDDTGDRAGVPPVFP